MSIKKKLYVAFSSIIAFLIIISTIAYTQLNKIDHQYTFLLEDRVHKVLEADIIINATSLQGVYIRSYILEPNDATLENLKNQEEIILEKTAELEKIITTPKLLEYLESLKGSETKFIESAQKIVDTYNPENLQRSIELLSTEIRPANEAIQSAANAIVEYQKSLLDETSKEASRITHLSTISILIITVFTILLAILIAILITRSITKPINKLDTAAKIIAEGDLSQKDFELKTKDEIGNLALSFNQMKSNLHLLVKNVADNVSSTTVAAEQLAASTDQVAITSNDVANRVEITTEGANQAAIVGQESAIAMDEMAKGVQQIAEATQNLNNKALDTQVIAKVGGETLQTAEKQMKVIQNSSHETSKRIEQLSSQSAEIGQIIKVITDITDQTNLLALNAAIEAARAGEHGKGFAVVADEVRKLAEQSKESASQIVGLTTSIQHETKEVEEAVNVTVQNVEEGVVFIQNAQVSFDEIMSAIQEITTQIEDVSASTQEISASTEEVSASINEMASASTNAAKQSEMIAASVEEQTATIQEINAVAKSLTHEAMKIQDEISKFIV